MPFLWLAVITASMGCAAEVVDGEALDEAEDKSLGGLVFVDGSCASLGEGFPDYRPIIRDAYLRGREAVRSQSFERAMRAADYRACATDPGDPSRPAEVIEWAIDHARTDSPIEVSCSHHTDRNGHAYVGSPSDTRERVWLARPYLNEVRLGNASVRDVAATLWHEVMHTKGWRHPFEGFPIEACAPPGDWSRYEMSLHSMPEIVENAVWSAWRVSCDNGYIAEHCGSPWAPPRPAHGAAEVARCIDEDLSLQVSKDDHGRWRMLRGWGRLTTSEPEGEFYFSATVIGAQRTAAHRVILDVRGDYRARAVTGERTGISVGWGKEVPLDRVELDFGSCPTKARVIGHGASLDTAACLLRNGDALLSSFGIGGAPLADIGPCYPR